MLSSLIGTTVILASERGRVAFHIFRTTTTRGTVEKWLTDMRIAKRSFERFHTGRVVFGLLSGHFERGVYQ